MRKSYVEEKRDFDINMSRSIAIKKEFDIKQEERKMKEAEASAEKREYFNEETERLFPDSEMVIVNGAYIPREIYDSDTAYRLRCKENGYEVK